MDPVTKIALDVGSSSLRVMMGQLDKSSNHLTVQEIDRVAHQPQQVDGQFRWDLERLTTFVSQSLTRLKQEYPTISSVGVDTWGVDYVVVNQHGRPLKPAVSYRDPRGGRGRAELKELVSEPDQYQITGILPQDINTIYQLRADREALQEITQDHDAKALLLPDFFSNLCAAAWAGVPAESLYIDGASRCISSTTGLLQHGNLAWAPALVKATGIPSMILPPVRDELQVAAEVDGLQVIRAGSHDTACAEFALPGESPRCLVSSGSWCVVSITLDKPLISQSAYTLGVTNEAAVGGGFRASLNLTGWWLLQQLGPEIRERFGDLSWGEIAERAAASATDSPVFEVQTEEAQQLISTLPGLLKHLGFAGDQDEDYWQAIRALVVSMAHSHATSLRQLAQLCDFTGAIYLVGGGSHNRLYTETMEQILGTKLTKISAEGSTMGNLLAQYTVAGFDKSAIKVEFI
ncbi:FGGY family carbohydrate kinase [Boudabousia marimammalium]|uniref:Rhamnulokinase n=1 Tax=Boudabousia marimammalium TaxID=156892 RepID=A0A1Q5PS85_9ACTO|nr:FGGY family carbohydrate kinase [Boudabousia marimammalium]OKL50437.1 hypothetical protein BM477_00205 [Boudabousia marimammalium]